MNNKIKELAKQAGAHFTTENLMSNPVQYRGFVEMYENEFEMFVDLLIEECAMAAERAARSFSDGNASDGCFAAANAVRHVGK